jgi:hypothetical protein
VTVKKIVEHQETLFPDVEQDCTDDQLDGDFLDSSRLGRYAEFMVCAELTRLGYHAIHVDAPGFDIILSIDGRSLRVQVKSTTTIKQPPLPQGRGRPPRSQAYAVWQCTRHQYSSNGGLNRRGGKTLTLSDTDIIALFHHKFETIVFFAVQDIKDKMMLPISQLETSVSEQSLNAVLTKLEVL